MPKEAHGLLSQNEKIGFQSEIHLFQSNKLLIFFLILKPNV